MSTFDDALAVAAAHVDAPAEAPAAEPSTPTEAPAEPAPASAEPQPEEPAPRVPPETLQKLRERNRQKREQAEREQERRELAELRARGQTPPKEPAGLDPKLLKSDPIKALEAAGIDPTVFLNTLSKHAITPDAAALEAKIEARLAEKDERIKALQDRLDRQDAEREHTTRTQAQQRARQEFIDNTSDLAKYPTLAKLKPDVRADYGVREAQRLINDEGIEDFSLADVAEMLEQRLQGELSELLGRDQAAAQVAEPTPSQQATNGRAKRPNTITSDAASSSSSQPLLMNEQERLAAAIAIASRK